MRFFTHDGIDAGIAPPAKQTCRRLMFEIIVLKPHVMIKPLLDGAVNAGERP